MTKEGQYRILFYTGCFIVLCILVKMFSDNTAQASIDAHKPCYATHTCWHNHTYANGTITKNGTVVATAQPTKNTASSSQVTAQPTKQTAKEKKAQQALADSNDSDYQAQQQQWNDDEQKRIGTSEQASTHVQPTPQTENATPLQGYSNATSFLVVTSQANNDSAICYVTACTVEITRLVATNGLSVIAHLPGHDVPVLILQQNNGYTISCSNLYQVVTMKQGYKIYVY